MIKFFCMMLSKLHAGPGADETRLFDPAVVKFSSLEDAVKAIGEREESDKKRFRKWYGIDPEDESQFDLVIDATGIKQTEVTDKIMGFLKEKGLL